MLCDLFVMIHHDAQCTSFWEMDLLSLDEKKNAHREGLGSCWKQGSGWNTVWEGHENACVIACA